jgi:hypothetical protein
MHSDGLKEFVFSLDDHCSFPHLIFAQESALYRNLPTENVAPMDESYMGGPPPLPPKDHLYNPPNYDGLESQLSQSTISTSQLTHMTAVERSKALRVARTEPYLQVSPFVIHRIVAHIAYSKVYVRTFIEVGPCFIVLNIQYLLQRPDTIQ